MQLWLVHDSWFGDWYVLAKDVGSAYKKVRAAQVKLAKRSHDEDDEHGPFIYPEEPDRIKCVTSGDRFVK